nr:hypothetical protein [uncultured Rhodopila sp.]
MTNPELKVFREILMWPLRLEGGSASRGEITEKAAELLEASAEWHRHKDLYDRSGAAVSKQGKQDERNYAEFVYFHPFVQNFLYPVPGGEPPALRLYYRKDVHVIALTAWNAVEQHEFAVELKVERLHLYLFELGIVVLVLEVVHDPASGSPPVELDPSPISTRHRPSLSLHDAQAVLDKLRHAYPAYWDGGRPGHCPISVRLVGARDTVLAEETFHNDPGHAFTNFVSTHHHPPFAGHWRYLLKPLAPRAEAGDRGVGYCHLLDERIPVLAFLAFDNPRALTEHDFARLCFADEPGSSAAPPYSPSILAGFADTYCYDRYWPPTAEPATAWMNTRYLCSGYAFVVTGSAAPDSFLLGDGLVHFRRHYFQLGLIAQFHKAALLAIENELAEAVRHLTSGPGQAAATRTLRNGIEAVHVELMRFTHRYWFLEVSNQVQARELFALWQRHLGTERLYDHVLREVKDIYGYLSAQADTRTAADSAWVSKAVAVTVPIALAATLLGSSTLVDEARVIRDTWLPGWHGLLGPWIGPEIMALAGGVALGLYLWVRRREQS